MYLGWGMSLSQSGNFKLKVQFIVYLAQVSWYFLRNNGYHRALNRRIWRLEATVKPKPVGCNPAVLFVIYEDTDQLKIESCRPSHEEIEKHLRHLQDSGQYLGCLGSCAMDWGPGGGAQTTSLPASAARHLPRYTY
jgi:hypothetical protein